MASKLTLDVSGAAAGMAGALGAVKSDLRKVVPSALNKTSARMKTLGTRLAAEDFALSTRKFGQYISVGKASQGKQSASLTFRVRAVPIEEFPVRVEMKVFEVKAWRGTARRRLPTVTVQRFRDAPYESPTGYAATQAFPLRQRRTGKLRKGEKVRRRTGKARGKLTRIRYFTFPSAWLDTQLLPALKREIPPRFQIELIAAFRSRRGKLKRNN